MRQIKFRGTDVETGETVYAELGRIHLMCKGDDYYFGAEHVVARDSVAQLVYTDKNGKEYYEDDILIKDGRKWRCKIVMDWQEVSQ